MCDGVHESKELISNTGDPLKQAGVVGARTEVGVKLGANVGEGLIERRLNGVLDVVLERLVGETAGGLGQDREPPEVATAEMERVAHAGAGKGGGSRGRRQ